MQNQIIQKQMGNLNVFEVKGSEEGPVIIMLHGFGANAQDLLPLHQQIKAPTGTTWLFPDAPIEMDLGGGYRGRAWFPLLSSGGDSLVRAGVDYSPLNPPGLAQANIEMMKMLAEIKTPLQKITLGGFSQGAMLATDLTLRLAQDVEGLVILSGTLINKKEWATLVGPKQKIQFFQSHGTQDPMLTFQGAKNLETVLRENGMTGEFVSFNGGHEIPIGVLKRLSQFLLR